MIDPLYACLAIVIALAVGIALGWSLKKSKVPLTPMQATLAAQCSEQQRTIERLRKQAEFDAHWLSKLREQLEAARSANDFWRSLPTLKAPVEPFNAATNQS